MSSTASRFTVTVLVLCLVQFVDVLGVTSAVVAIPSMLDGVGAGDASAGPVATAYAMLFGGLLIVGARLGHRYGHVRLLLVGLSVFAVAGVLGAVSLHAWQLVLARAVQGAASALSVPAALTLLLSAATEPAQRSKALGVWSAAGAVAGASGLFVGGAVTELLGWRAIFWLTVPLGIGLALAVRVWVAVRPPRDPRASLDLAGGLLLVVAVMGLVLGASMMEEPPTRLRGTSVLAVAVAGAVAFVARLRTARQPLIPLAVLRSPPVLVGTLGSFVNTAVTSSTAILLTLHLQRSERFSAFDAGLTLLALSLGVVVGSAAAPPVARRHGPRRMAVLGLRAMALGNLLVAPLVTQPTSDRWPLVGIMIGLGLVGAGLGLSSVACNDIGTQLPPAEVTAATGLLNTGAQLGTAIGVAALLLIASVARLGSAPGESVAVGLAGVLALSGAAALRRWHPEPIP